MAKSKKDKITYKYDFEKNKIEKFSKKVQDVDEAIEKAEAVDVTPLHDFFMMAKEKDMPICFFGAGGASSPATFATQLCHAEGMVAQTMTPMAVLDLPEGVVKKMLFLAISGGGGPSDMVAATEYLLKIAPEQVYCLTTSDIDHKNRYGQLSNRVGQKMKEYGMERNALCCGLSLHQDGFVGTKKHVGMALLLYRAFHPEEAGLLKKLILPEVEPFEVRLPEGMTLADVSDLHILYGALGACAGVDMEGRMLECGVMPAMATDMKNFTHGRHTFINTRPCSTLLMLLSPKDEKFCTEMLKLIPQDRPVIFIRTNRSDMLGALQLMICTFYLSIDLCAPRGIKAFAPEGTPAWGGKLWSLKLSEHYVCV